MVAIKKKAVEIQPEDYILAIFKILSIGNKATQEKNVFVWSTPWATTLSVSRNSLFNPLNYPTSRRKLFRAIRGKTEI